MYLSEAQLMSGLEKDGREIGKQAKAGDEVALKVVRYYDMWAKCPGDGMSFVLCERAYDEWRNRADE